jgi:hypothetical protein
MHHSWTCVNLACTWFQQIHASHHGNTLVGLAQMILFIKNAENFQIFSFSQRKKRKIEGK